MEWVAGDMLAIHGIRPPFFFFVLAYWFWSVPFMMRLWIAIGAGMVMDSISFFPFGVFTIAFVSEAGFVEMLQSFLSNVKSLITRMIGAIIMLCVFFGVVPIMISFLSRFSGPAVSLISFISLGTIGAALVWSFMLPVLLYGMLYFFEYR